MSDTVNNVTFEIIIRYNDVSTEVCLADALRDGDFTWNDNYLWSDGEPFREVAIAVSAPPVTRACLSIVLPPLPAAGVTVAVTEATCPE